jgi:hypothetical protein
MFGLTAFSNANSPAKTKTAMILIHDSSVCSCTVVQLGQGRQHSGCSLNTTLLISHLRAPATSLLGSLADDSMQV